MENLFTRFAVFYGHLWRSQFKSDGFLEFAKKEWLDGLTRFSDEILNQAIVECRDHCEMPPTLPQMIRCCRDIQKRTTFFVAPKEFTPASQEVVETNIKQCKAFLI
ncbi:TPA: Vir protein [Legionella pneumophila]|nr:Vir protein [Legionella pneumophila]